MAGRGKPRAIASKAPRFGIVCEAQRQLLIQRARKEAENRAERSLTHRSTHPDPLLVTEEFVHRFNSHQHSAQDRERLNNTAQAMLARCRRRAGIFTRGRGPHVNLPSAWLELSVLSQCSGHTGIEALQMLCTSAEQTELEPAVASPLLALAKWAVAHLLVDGARLQGLPVFAANTALSHLTLLRLCECVCLRLYCLKLTGAIPENNAFEEYMYGLVELEDAYSLVPCARLSVNIIVAASVAESNFLPESASSQFLRRSLMLWLCVRDRNRHSDHHQQQQHQQQLLLGHALNSARFIREDEWPQGAVGLLVLGDAAANGETFILRELQRSFAGVPPYPEPTEPAPPSRSAPPCAARRPAPSTASAVASSGRAGRTAPRPAASRRCDLGTRSWGALSEARASRRSAREMRRCRPPGGSPRRSSVTQRDHWPALQGPPWPICCAEHKVTTTTTHHHHHLSTTTKPRQRRRPGPLEEICGSHLNPPRESFLGFLSLQVDNPAPLSSRGPTLTCDRLWTANSPAASERLAGGDT
ncbi:transmembrane protein 232 isoform X2 [Lampetra fluviatilis]